MPQDRRTAIADAAIHTLALAGSRGLTHRAVDRAAGLPLGSTSYYFRSRADLLRAAVDRLAELDSAALQLEDGDSLADDLARVVDQFLTSERDRVLARYELALEAVRRPELRELMDTGTRRVRHAIAERLRVQQGTDADRLADDVLALIDGLLLAELTAGHKGPRSRADLTRSLARLTRSP